MLNVSMDVFTQFNVYKLKYVCTHRYHDPENEKRPVGVSHYIYLIADNEKAVEFWFREEFNCHGDIHDLLSVELVTEGASFDIMGYHRIGEERADFKWHKENGDA